MTNIYMSYYIYILLKSNKTPELNRAAVLRERLMESCVLCLSDWGIKVFLYFFNYRGSQYTLTSQTTYLMNYNWH